MAKFKDNQNQVAASYLGGLRSELDDEATIDSSFSSLELAFGLVRSAYVSKKLTAIAAAELFRSLYIRSADGADWTLGSSTATWYRKDPGSKWVAASAPVGVTVDSNSLGGWVYDGIDKDLAEAVTMSASMMEPEDHSKLSTPTMIINQSDMRDTREEKSASYNYTIFGAASTSQDQNIDWLQEEWELAGEQSVAQHLTGVSNQKLVESELTQAQEAKTNAETVENSASDDSHRSGHFNPEDFFLKDGQ